ncbi:glycosyltransferase [Sulfitobacter sp. M57]|uniref:TIGR04283 family arsenosugar biosynthesis glycosyltransferase n=1 Tax=unclassified Sulfitobacter TaxID=196795 RepID=UPI0023E30AC1|nr:MULTISPECIES: TIGR04283 family arsenosugar biosynthesis glycosyltransferase [unclassified Sulfitobacter]MDF3413047.1 glycosyltransferase [Sulfitobacter sp. KE5]MDF3421669.1 glycosyltransferase [Sulfitobacter sp. KE43]MDF3431596.1 glycosyltransferase [Sulfitobacter sp. KE42]MDF3457237.1 glycosyltransferase [Sulfitobacter sp. S74]MDF3461140.1 glycosyltransferase [Sulfitobacter sp. Ks18]
MRAPISVIIPTFNAEHSLPACLGGLMEGVDAGVIRELIVSDGGSTDATGAIAQAWGAEITHGAPSRGGQLRRGCAAATGDWLLVVHADTVLQEGWSKRAQAHLAQPEQAAWFRLAFDHSGVAAGMVAGWANLRSRFGLPYGDQGLLISSALYTQVGGFPDQPLMEDVAIARALKGRLVALDAVARTSADKYRRQGWIRRGGRNLVTLLRYFAGADVAALAAQYRR